MNAQAARTLVLAWRTTGHGGYRQAAEATLSWLTRALAHAEGGFIAAQFMAGDSKPPSRDDRRLLGANALMLGALTDAALAFEEAELIQAAAGLADHLLQWPRCANGKLQHRHRSPADSGPPAAATAADLATLLDGLMGLGDAQPSEPRWLLAAATVASELQDTLASAPASFAAGHGLDTDLPSAAGLAALGLRRLGLRIAEPHLATAAAALLSRYQAAALADPLACATLIVALERNLPARLIDLTEPLWGTTPATDRPVVVALVGSNQEALARTARAVTRYAAARGLSLSVCHGGQPPGTAVDLVLALAPTFDTSLKGNNPNQFDLAEFVRLGLDATPRQAGETLHSWLATLRDNGATTVGVVDTKHLAANELELLAEGVVYVLSRIDVR